MRLTVLGSAASYPGAGRACAGHLVTDGSTALLLDCGNGVLSNLATVMDPTRLSAVFVTHGHIDHFADVFALQAALRYAPDGPAAPVPLFLPAGLFERMRAVLGERGAEELAEAFSVHTLAAERAVVIGAVAVTPHRVDHSGDTFALVAEAGGARLCYTSDTRYGPAAEAAAAESGVVLAEATLPPAFAGRAPHMTPGEAGVLARRAGAHTLVLTHLWPTVDRVAASIEAGEAFDGRVIVADELTSLDIT